MGEKVILGGDCGTSAWKIAGETVEGGKYIGQLNEPEEGAEWTSRVIVPNGFVQNPMEAYVAFNRAVILFCKKNNIDPEDIVGVGIGGRMHGLIGTDNNFVPVADELMWNFSASDSYREKAMESISPQRQKKILRGFVGNFWGAKYQWACDNIPGFKEEATRLLLIENFIAGRLTGEFGITRAGASETLLFNHSTNDWATSILKYFGISRDKLPPIRGNLTRLGNVSEQGALETILLKGTPIADIGGDQHLGALGLKVISPGNAGFVGGQSGVEYVVSAKPVVEVKSRVNTFVHSVPTSGGKNVNGLLACLNAAGQFYKKLRDDLGEISYKDMDRLAAEIPFGSDGLRVLPYVFGGERIFENKGLKKVQWVGYDGSKHTNSHKYRAALEAFATWYKYSAELIEGMGAKIDKVRVANDGLFKNNMFCEWIATLLDVPVERYETTGARGAVKGARVALLGEDLDAAYKGFEPEKTFDPNEKIRQPLQEVYGNNKALLIKRKLITLN